MGIFRRRRSPSPDARAQELEPAAAAWTADLRASWLQQAYDGDPRLAAWSAAAGFDGTPLTASEALEYETHVLSRLARACDEASATDVDRARLLAYRGSYQDDPERHGRFLAECATQGAAALARGARDLPSRAALHNLVKKQVLLGRVASSRDLEVAAKNPHDREGRLFGVDMDVLRTSMLVVGPPGSGKTHGIAAPIIEHLSLQALAGCASLVVLDPKGDDFDRDGWFDVTIDMNAPSHGFGLFGGAETAHEGADRLAAALLPPASAETAYFVDASKNALYSVLAPFTAANGGKWPTVRQLLDMLSNPSGSTMQSVRDRLKHQNRLDEFRLELEMRERQSGLKQDAAASLSERLGLLNRPHLVRLLDETRPRFDMLSIREPTRVRIALPEEQSPDAVKILGRLAISQFVQVVSSPATNRDILKCLVCDEASRFLDDYVTAAVRKIRSNNAGMVLLTQSLGDIPIELRTSLFGSTGCKAVFAGLSPSDARELSDYWGTNWVQDVTRQVSGGYSASVSHDPMGLSRGGSESESAGWSQGVRDVERPIWSPSEITNSIPTHHCIVSLARSDGHRSPPLLVDLRRELIA